jgi:hypothetical protein
MRCGGAASADGRRRYAVVSQAFQFCTRAAETEQARGARRRSCRLSISVNLTGKISAVDINPIGLSAGSSEITVLDAKIHV